MKPMLLELQAFGPYVEKQTVDFEKLSTNGMFLITGQTGSGKTTIFDAITFALYGEASGTDDERELRNDFSKWRCSQATDDLATFVAFTFSIRDRVYFFKRSLVMRRVNLSPLYECGELDENGVVTPFFENPKKNDLTKKAVELIGLNKDQFRKVVMLPQGQFEQFLVATSEKKEEILKNIFGADFWKKYADRFYSAADARKKELDEEKLIVTNSLREDGLTDLAGLAARIEALGAQRADITQKHKEFDGQKKREALNADLRLAEQFRPLHALLQKQAELNGAQEEIDRRRALYEKAEKAEAVRPAIDAYEKAKTELTNRRTAFRKAQAAVPGAEKAAQLAKTKKEAHDARSPAADLNRQIGICEEKRETYQNIDRLRSALDAAVLRYNAAKKADDDSRAAAEEAVNGAAAAKQAFDEADARAKACRDRYFAGIYGEIAADLREGAPCPVCGSTLHPAPAAKSENSVSKEDVDAAEKCAEMKRKLWDGAEKHREEAQTVRKEAETAMLSARSGKDRAETDLLNAQKQLLPGINDLDGLEKTIERAKEQILLFTRQSEELQRETEAAARLLNEAAANEKSAEKEASGAALAFERAEQALSDALRANGYADITEAKTMLRSAEERRLLNETVAAHTAALRQNTHELGLKKTELQGKTEPDAASFKHRQREIDEEATRFNQTDAALKKDVERLTQKQKRLAQLDEHYRQNIHQAQNDLSFAKFLRGDTGMGLQRYVLAIMFNQVIAEANRMLEKVHAGRYSLYRTDKGSKNKSGLELNARDNRRADGEGRNVSMLSGGEKFLVSLALSIGLSTVAKSSGAQIDALFIDEGFGTLDNESIQDALDVLESVRKGSAVIGIISHVEALEENIPVKLEIKKTENGSYIKG